MELIFFAVSAISVYKVFNFAEIAVICRATYRIFIARPKNNRIKRIHFRTVSYIFSKKAFPIFWENRNGKTLIFLEMELSCPKLKNLLYFRKEIQSPKLKMFLIFFLIF